jgi:lipopolysaccharide transport system permease protein
MSKKFIVEANRTGSGLDLGELIQYKDLFVTLAWRDFKVRYAQTVVGFLWAFIQPLFQIGVLFMVFGRFLKVDTDPHVHLINISIGTCAWTFFSYVVTNSGSSIISSQQMVKKIYFPRLILPISKAFVGLIDLGVSLLILTVLMFAFGIFPSGHIIYFPLFLIVDVLAALGVGIWLSGLTIRYRDFQYVVPFCIQLGFYVTPIGYSVATVTKTLSHTGQILYYLNPLVGIIEGMRWSLLGGTPPGMMTLASVVLVLVIFVSGLFYFKSVERQIADIV